MPLELPVSWAGVCFCLFVSLQRQWVLKEWFSAINMSLTFCMGTDLQGLLDSPIGQPMAQIFLNSFGQKGTLALWSIVVLAQYMMGSSMVGTVNHTLFCTVSNMI